MKFIPAKKEFYFSGINIPTSMNELLYRRIPRLTAREKDILSLIALGIGTKQIAERLKISRSTVANHRKNMLAKTGAKTSAELVYLTTRHSTADT